MNTSKKFVQTHDDQSSLNQAIKTSKSIYCGYQVCLDKDPNVSHHVLLLTYKSMGASLT